MHPIPLVLGTLALSIAASAPGPASAQADQVVEHQVTVTTEQDAAVRGYWTPERVKAMDPGPTTDPADSGDAGGAEWPGGKAVSSTVGRLFFSKKDGDESCTGTVVRSANQAVVITAA